MGICSCNEFASLPQGNGGVERAVEIAKTLMKKAFEDGEAPY